MSYKILGMDISLQLIALFVNRKVSIKSLIIAFKYMKIQKGSQCIIDKQQIEEDQCFQPSLLIPRGNFKSCSADKNKLNLRNVPASL